MCFVTVYVYVLIAVTVIFFSMKGGTNAIAQVLLAVTVTLYYRRTSQLFKRQFSLLNHYLF
jgi:hypothetical protein